MKVFIVFFESGSYDDHSYNLSSVFVTRSLAESYIEKKKEKNACLSSLTEKYQELGNLYRTYYFPQPEPLRRFINKLIKTIENKS